MLISPNTNIIAPSLSRYPHHDRPYAAEPPIVERHRNKNNLVITTTETVASEYEVERSGPEVLSPIQEASPAAEGTNYVSSNHRVGNGIASRALSGRRSYHPRHQRLDFSRARGDLPAVAPRNQLPLIRTQLDSSIVPTIPAGSTSRNAATQMDDNIVRGRAPSRRAEESALYRRDCNTRPLNAVFPPKTTTVDVQGSSKISPKINAEHPGVSHETISPTDSVKSNASNARFDFLHGAVNDQESHRLSSLIVPQRAPKSYLERLAELEEIEKSGQDLLDQLATKEPVAPAAETKPLVKNRRPRDTIFVANTINAGRQTINNIKASIDENSDAAVQNDSFSLSDESDDDIDWTLGALDQQDHAVDHKLAVPLYKLNNISISDYLRDIDEAEEESSQYSEKSQPEVNEMDCASKQSEPTLTTDCSSQVPAIVISTPGTELAQREQQPDSPSFQDLQQPDSPTFVDFDVPVKKSHDTVKRVSSRIPVSVNRRNSNFKHRRTSNFYEDQWYLEPDAQNNADNAEYADVESATTATPARFSPDHDKEVVQIQPNNRRRSNSAPTRFSGSANWRHSFALTTEPKRTLLHNIQVKNTPLYAPEARISQKPDSPILQKESPNHSNEMPNRYHGYRDSTMTELVITREEALGIFPPFRNRVSIASRRESRGNTLSTCMPQPIQEEEWRPPSMQAPSSIYPSRPTSLTTFSDITMKRLSSARAPSLLKKKDVRKKKIGAPTLVTSSSSIPTVDLQQARLIHSVPHLQKTNKSSNRLRNLLSSNKSKSSLTFASTTNLKVSSSLLTMREYNPMADKSRYVRTDFDAFEHPGYRKPVKLSLASPAYFSGRPSNDYHLESRPILPDELRDSGFSSFHGKF